MNTTEKNTADEGSIVEMKDRDPNVDPDETHPEYDVQVLPEDVR